MPEASGFECRVYIGCRGLRPRGLMVLGLRVFVEGA